jgi:hypothetical protein
MRHPHFHTIRDGTRVCRVPRLVAHLGTTPQPDAFPSYAWDFPRRDPQLTTRASGQPPRSAGQNPRREFSAPRARGQVRALPLAVARPTAKGRRPATGAWSPRRRCATRSGVGEIRGHLGIGPGGDRRSWRNLACGSGGGGGRQAAGAALLARRALLRGPRLLLLGSPPSGGRTGGRRQPAHSNALGSWLEVRRRALHVGGTAPRVASLESGPS